MKLFLDSIDHEKISYWQQMGLIDGITTNPSLLAKQSNNPTPLIKEICRIMQGKDVSVEVTHSDPHAVYTQAHEIANLADNVVVKIPCHQQYYPVIKKLIDEQIPLNITLLFSLAQGLLMFKLGVKYISPFIARLDDIGTDGIALIDQLRTIKQEYLFEHTQILSASIRTIDHVHQALMAGSDVATIPVAVLEKMTQHPLTDHGIQKFLDDWNTLGITNFP